MNLNFLIYYVVQQVLYDYRRVGGLYCFFCFWAPLKVLVMSYNTLRASLLVQPGCGY